MTHKRSATLHDRLDELENQINQLIDSFKRGFWIGMMCGVVISGIITWVVFTYF